MWSARTNPLPGGGSHTQLDRDGGPATIAAVLTGWRTDATFRAWFNALLATTPDIAFRWETPAVTASDLGRPFEFVLIPDATLARRPADPSDFAENFADSTDGVATFPNLGRNAVLVVPCPLTDAAAYGHLAAFVRFAPETQQHALWRAVGEAMAARVSERPVWLSTAGAGVPWLHVRLDDRPKYYRHGPYRDV